MPGTTLFLTGKAGTGKSTLIRHYLESTARRTITVAPTGIAALNVDGYTIHRLFSFPIGVTEEMVRGGGYYPRRFAKALKELDTLIVDEASMVRADLFDALTAALERFGPQPGTPFGGVQLVLVGDLYQLPPVVTDHEAAWIEERFGTPFFFSARSFDTETFPVVELGTVFRQLGDDHLVHLLNAVREGTLLEDARAELNRRTDADFEPDLDEFWLTLATTNRIVGARNRQMLERLPDPPQTFSAQISGDTDGFEHPTDSSLSLAVGAQVMMLTNDGANRWVNGTLGRITEIGTDDDGPVITVLLRNGRTAQVRRHTWDITRPSVHGGSLVHQVVGTFTQLPMKLAWAITIHKSQGQTPRPGGRGPHRRHLRERSAVRGAVALHEPRGPGAEARGAPPRPEDRPAGAALSRHRRRAGGRARRGVPVGAHGGHRRGPVAPRALSRSPW